ncbi:nucleolar GTP-binding protein 1 [Planococcus citri]|uniref:nucleolar GTP-binding protein 1 n=1 Tax=Planococcus citri TaxID=170843 RepID=UPI0031F77414
MPMYNFKKITVVPTAKDMINIMLSKTQRKTPTVIHKHYKISRIRSFYMRKVKFTQTNFHERLSLIIQEFPKLENVHPFYADLMNTLYDKDHYKLALGQVNQARHLIDNVGKEYVRLLKFGDSLYRCKMLKKAALGRMVTIMKKQAPNLVYLEQVRQHLSRLPTIDPYTRTIILCGFPNVGKSSFLNKITRADVEVHSYAFTTKSLYVGHTDYKYLRWQVIDTPGVLDHPLEERNIIEMQAITALAHLRAAILYFVDVSERCGYSIAQQIKLYESIKPLFTNKPLMVVCNKIDIVPLSELSDENKEALTVFEKENIPVLSMSTMTDEGIMEVKQTACDTLLTYRVENKVHAKKLDTILNRLHVAVPQKRDNKERPPCIPESVLQKKQLEDMKAFKRKLEKELEEELGDDYTLDLKKNYDLPEEYKYDIIPEFWEGHNIADFIDPDILQKLEQLEKEEQLREEAGFYAVPKIELDETLKEIRSLALRIRERKSMMRQESRITKQSNKPTIPRNAPARVRERSVSTLRDKMQDLGVDMSETEEAHFTRTRGRARSLSRSSARSQSRPAKRLKTDVENRSTSRSQTRPPRDQSGVKDVAMKNKLKNVAHKAIAKKVKKQGLKGEADRFIGVKKPKHLYAGKRGIGKTDRR